MESSLATLAFSAGRAPMQATAALQALMCASVFEAKEARGCTRKLAAPR